MIMDTSTAKFGWIGCPSCRFKMELVEKESDVLLKAPCHQLVMHEIPSQRGFASPDGQRALELSLHNILKDFLVQSQISPDLPQPGIPVLRLSQALHARRHPARAFLLPVGAVPVLPVGARGRVDRKLVSVHCTDQ